MSGVNGNVIMSGYENNRSPDNGRAEASRWGHRRWGLAGVIAGRWGQVLHKMVEAMVVG